jgi:dienelactone hydrolase
MNSRQCASAWALALAVGWAASTVSALGAGPRVLPPGQVPSDGRLAPLKDLDGYFPFDPPASREAWDQRAEAVRRRILVSQGLWPLPTRTPMNPVIHGRIGREGYTVEKVYFESRPGLFVTGNLYRPTRPQGKVPGVLFAHGHWTDARLSESGDAELRRELANGEERFEEGGRSRFQSLCVQLARMGCVVWQWDMLGNSDSQQISMEVAHGFARQRPEMNAESGWGLYSPQAEAHLQSVMGLQTWNAVRSLDFLLSLPEVDPTRIAMTGASGGATQTMLLAGVDPRVALSFPAVMVSTAMQGGCTCENASLLRVGTGNVEFAGLFAPKPQGLTTANDWTREMAAKGFPELQKLYAMLGAPDQVMLKRGEHFPHNYNAVSRSAFYGWLNRHFKLGQTEPVIEQDYQRLRREELTVWDSAHPAPKAADPEFERNLLKQWHEDDQRRLGEESATAAGFREVYGKAWEVVLDGDIGTGGAVEWEMLAKEDRGGWIEMTGLMKTSGRRQQLPAVYLYPRQWNGRTTVWLSAEGKAGLYGADGRVQPAVRRLVDAGHTVVGVDLLYQGEFLADGQPLRETPKVKNPREAWAYTFGYNPALFVERVHDVLAVLRYVRDHERRSSRIDLVAVDGMAPVAAAARAQARGAVGRAVLGLGTFRFGSLRDLRHPDFAPGAAKYGDVDGLLALAAPGDTLLLGGAAGPVARREYDRANGGRARALKTASPRDAAETNAAVTGYLLEP